MSFNTTDHTENLDDTSDADVCKAAPVSAEIIRWLLLLAANDFLDEDDIPPAA